MFKFKSTIVTPITVIFASMLIIIMFMVAAKPQPVVAPQPELTIYEQHEIEILEVKRDYQLQLMDNGHKVALYDGNRLVEVLSLDNHCNLTNAILADNE